MQERIKKMLNVAAVSPAHSYHGYKNEEELLGAIEGGEVATVLLPDEQRLILAAYLFAEARHEPNSTLAEAMQSTARQLQAAIEREQNADIIDWIDAPFDESMREIEEEEATDKKDDEQ